MKVSLDIQGLEELNQLINNLFSEDNIADLNRIGINASLAFIKDYHNDFDINNGWKNLSLSTHGAGRKSSGFGQNVTRGWLAGDVDSTGASLDNAAPHLAFKVTGGEIVAKRAANLTIPVIPEAHGVKASDYPNKLFRPKGKNVLMESLSDGTVRSVYALKPSVTQRPVEGALPDNEELLAPFVESILDELDKI